MARSRRGPLIPPERLRPPSLDWSEQLRRAERDHADTARPAAGPSEEMRESPTQDRDEREPQRASATAAADRSPGASADASPVLDEATTALEPVEVAAAQPEEADATSTVDAEPPASPGATTPQQSDATSTEEAEPVGPPDSIDFEAQTLESEVVSPTRDQTEAVSPAGEDAGPVPTVVEAEAPTVHPPVPKTEAGGATLPVGTAPAADDGDPSADEHHQQDEALEPIPLQERSADEYQREFDALVAPPRMRLEHDAPPARAIRERAEPVLSTPWVQRTRHLDLNGRAAGTALIAVLAAACVALLVLNVQRINDSQNEAARQAAAYSPPALDASGRPAGAPLVSVVGGDTLGVGVEAVPSTTLLSRGLDGADVRIHTAPTARYVGTGGDRNTFQRLAGAVAPDSTGVVLFGGSDDRNDATRTLASAAQAAVEAVRRAAPNARILIVGPVWASSRSAPPELLRVRSTLKAAAASASADFVDPIADRWLQGRSGLVAASGRLTDAGRQELAKRLTRAIAAYLK